MIGRDTPIAAAVRWLHRRLRLGGQRAWRPEWLPWTIALQREDRAHPHVPRERAELFLAYNAGTTEIEVLNWLHATVCLLKPRLILETGAADGLGTLALASACRANGFGTVHAVEIDPRQCARVERRLRRHGLERHARVLRTSSFEHLGRTTDRYEIGFFDSLVPLRAAEFSLCLERQLVTQLAVFHDTSEARSESWPDNTPPAEQSAYRARLAELARHPACRGGFESPLSRGLTVLHLHSPPKPV